MKELSKSEMNHLCGGQPDHPYDDFCRSLDQMFNDAAESQTWTETEWTEATDSWNTFCKGWHA